MGWCSTLELEVRERYRELGRRVEAQGTDLAVLLDQMQQMEDPFDSGAPTMADLQLLVEALLQTRAAIARCLQEWHESVDVWAEAAYTRIHQLEARVEARGSPPRVDPRDADSAEPKPRAVVLCSTIFQGERRVGLPSGAMEAVYGVHDEVYRPLLPQFEGRELGRAGEDFLCQFRDVRQAMACCAQARQMLVNVPWARVLQTAGAGDARARDDCASEAGGFEIGMGLDIAPEDAPGGLTAWDPAVRPAKTLAVQATPGTIFASHAAFSEAVEAHVLDSFLAGAAEPLEPGGEAQPPAYALYPKDVKGWDVVRCSEQAATEKVRALAGMRADAWAPGA